MMQIIAIGGVMTVAGILALKENEKPPLTQYIIDQARVERPKICFLTHAMLEFPSTTINFYVLFNRWNCQPSHLSLLWPHTDDLERYFMEQDIVYVGGGNTKSMLALWREWELDRILLKAAQNGTILAGNSAGAICWFEKGVTDSIPGKLTPLTCLGYLKGSCAPHYDTDPNRRPILHQLIASGEIPPGVGFDDMAAGHYIDGELKYVVSGQPDAKGYRVDKVGDAVQETVLETRYLSA
jgi:dipeptidase E